MSFHKKLLLIIVFVALLQFVSAGTYVECTCHKKGGPHFPGKYPTYDCGKAKNRGCHYNGNDKQKSWFFWANYNKERADFIACCKSKGKVGFCRETTGWGLCG
ncbi:hypothetical protein BC940DRAFT_300891 [Gongronella butleri]|nr:hypothetical protein BC940DRAFT_300891 [Gongronella butleri]